MRIRTTYQESSPAEYEAFIQHQSRNAGRPEPAPATLRGLGPQAGPGARPAEAVVRSNAREAVPARPRDPRHHPSRRLRDRATDLPEPARGPGDGQPLSPGPGRAVATRPSSRSTATGPGRGSTRMSSRAASAWPSWATWSSASMPSARASGPSSRGPAPTTAPWSGPRSGRSGRPLIGLQVYDNRRAVDYLISRPEVDPAKLAITGASGGGNQTLYAGATDDRLAAVIPVCGIGTYDAYLTTACCVCEVNPGGAVLRHDRRPAGHGRTPRLAGHQRDPRRLPVQRRRGRQEHRRTPASGSASWATRRRSAMSPSNRATITTSPCARRCTAGSSDGCAAAATVSPIPEPAHVVEDVEALRCYPQGTARPRTVVTIPEFARSEGRERLAALPAPPDHRERWAADSERMRIQLRDRDSRGLSPQGTAGIPIETRPGSGGVRDHDGERHPFAWSRGSGQVKSRNRPGDCRPGRRSTAIGIRRSGPGSTRSSRNGVGPGSARWNCRISEAPADGWPTRARWSGWRTTRSAEWGIWVGRPLLGQWVWDIDPMARSARRVASRSSQVYERTYASRRAVFRGRARGP